MAIPNPIDALLAGVKQYLAELDDDQFAELVAEVREPEDTSKPSSEMTKFVRSLTGNK